MAQISMYKSEKSVINDGKVYLLFGPLNTLQHTFDTSLIYPDIKYIPENVNSLINIGGRMYNEIIEASLIVSFS